MKWLYAVLAVLATVLIAAGAAIGWLVGTEAGLHWAAARAGDQLAFENLRGRLAGEMAADRLVYSAEDLRIQVDRVSLRAHLAALLGGRLTIEPLHAASLQIDLIPGDKAPATGAPKLPVRLHLGDARIDEVIVRHGDARYVLREVAIAQAIIGERVSVSASLYYPDERFATRGTLELDGTLERIDARVQAVVAGVPTQAHALVTPYSAQKIQAIEARAGPADLARFDASLPHTALTASIKAEPTPGGALAGTLSATNAAAGPIDAGRVPVARLETRFLTDFTSARLSQARLALYKGGTIEGEAELQAGSIHARLVAAAVDLRTLHTTLRQTSLSGPLQIRLEGERLWARGSLTQEGIGLTAEIVRKGELLEVLELRALAEGGEVSGTGKIRLDGAKRFDARLSVERFDPAALGDYPAGSLSGSALASGRLDPRQVDVKWSLRDSTLYGHTFRSEGSARVVGERVTQADADVRLGANRLTARGAYGRPGDALALTLEAPRLEEFAPIGGSLRARGTLTGTLDNPRVAFSGEADVLQRPGAVQLRRVAAKLSGTLSSHEAEISATAPEFALDAQASLRGGWSAARGWVGEVTALRNTGAYPLTLTAPAPLRLAPGRVELGRLEARLADGRLLIRDAAWSPARLSSSGEVAGLPAQWLIVAAGLGERVSSTMLVDADWQLGRGDQLEGIVRARRASGDLGLAGPDGVIDLGLSAASVEARFAGGRITTSAEIVARVARVVLQGQVAPELALQAKVEFAEVRTLARPLIEEARVDGRLSAELRATGTLKQPVIHGTLSGEGLSFELPAYGVALKDGTLSARLEGDHLKVESFSVRGGEGRFSATGTLPLGAAGTARIAWKAEKLGLLERPDMRLVASGEGEVSYDGTRVALNGELRADRGHFEFERDRLPTLGDDVVVIGQDRPPPKGRMKLPIALDLRLDLGSDLVVRAYGLDGKVAGLVDLSTTKEGELRAHGRLYAVHATFLAYGQTLQVDPGVVIFDGPIDNPSLQITAWRRNQAVEAGVQVSGTVRNPNVQLVSQPPVPEGERLSWLVLGRAPSGATQADLGLLQAAAGALLAGGDSVPLDRRIARKFGLDEIALRGTGELTDRVVAVGKRLSDRVYISYEQGIGAVASNLIKLDYALGRRWTLRAETGTSSGGGLFYRYSWD
ncbi:MAG TPA: translocation/assembly module TamB domain-containing protein [Burkholderiales bacterium]|nr:translocation/assembly module TamB domain-containing protein [Burkholderiales bacterium]